MAWTRSLYCARESSSLVGAGAARTGGTKHQAPTTKLQRNFKHQAPKESPCIRSGFGIWSLVLLWSLVLGAWCFLIAESTPALLPLCPASPPYARRLSALARR